MKTAIVQARVHQEEAIALYDSRKHNAVAFGQGYDLGMDARAHGAWVLWYLGYPEQALKRNHEALTVAQELAHPYSLAHAPWCAAWLHQLRREAQTVRDHAEASIALSTEYGFAQEIAWGTFLRGWALAQQGQVEEGIAQMRQGLIAWRATGAETFRPYYFALLAEAYGKAGQAAEGLALLAEAFAVMHKTGEGLYEAELYRLKGELTLQQFKVGESPKSEVRSPESEAEECFRQALDVARRQQAKSLELRAMASLSRLWQQQGKKDEARQMLADVYTSRGQKVRFFKKLKA